MSSLSSILEATFARLILVSRRRASLIRKSNLAHTIALYLSKNPDSPLRRATPQTFHFSCSFADEIDELLMDDLYEVEQSFAEAENGGEKKWWILKAALADKGNGIRLFSSRETLEDIFREFEPESDDEEDEDEAEEEPQAEGMSRAAMFGADTRVDATQLREWVIQVRLHHPALPPHADTLSCRNISPRPYCSILHLAQTHEGPSFTCGSTSSPSAVSPSTFTTLSLPFSRRRLILLPWSTTTQSGQANSTCRHT